MTASSGILKVKYKENPYVEDGVFAVPIRRKGERLETYGPLRLLDTSTGEAVDVAEIRKTKTVDSEKFVKLFVGHLHAFFDLKPGTIRIMTALIDELSNARYMNGDTIYLNYSRAREYFEKKGAKPPAKATFFSAMAELTENGFIAPSVDQNLWFINPSIFFNGDRIRFVTELRRKRVSRIQELENAGQTRLGFDDDEEEE